MDYQNTQLFPDAGYLPPESVLGSKYFNPAYLFDKLMELVSWFFHLIFSNNFWSTYKSFLFLLAIFFMTIIVYSIVRLFEIRKKEHEHHHHAIHEYAVKHAKKQEDLESQGVSRNPRWRQVLNLLFSASPNDWKLSVIEADTMLDALLTELGFKGDTLGGKLKDAGEKGFRQLNTAWEVHTIRNRIAHEGSIFEISHHEAKRVIALYEQIFRDFGFI